MSLFILNFYRLSASYKAQALRLTPRVAPNPAQVVDISKYSSYTTSHRKLYCSNPRSACLASWFQPQRPLPSGNLADTVSLTLVIPAGQMSKYLDTVRAMQEGGPAPAQLTVASDFRGFKLIISFVSSGLQQEGGLDMDNFVLRVRLCARLPQSSSTADLQRGIPCSCRFSVGSNLSSRPLFSATVPVDFCSTSFGVRNFAQKVSGLGVGTLVCAWPAEA